MLERIAAAQRIDTIELFSGNAKLPETLKKYRKAALEDIKGLLGQFIDEKLKELGKKV